MILPLSAVADQRPEDRPDKRAPGLLVRASCSRYRLARHGRRTELVTAGNRARHRGRSRLVGVGKRRRRPLVARHLLARHGRRTELVPAGNNRTRHFTGGRRARPGSPRLPLREGRRHRSANKNTNQGCRRNSHDCISSYQNCHSGRGKHSERRHWQRLRASEVPGSWAAEDAPNGETTMDRAAMPAPGRRGAPGRPRQAFAALGQRSVRRSTTFSNSTNAKPASAVAVITSHVVPSR